ncbi:4355_t:CDS:2, partial [Funneliformis mosseae]
MKKHKQIQIPSIYDCTISIIDKELNIIVLHLERNKYLRWKLPNIAHLIQKNLKIDNSFDMFKLDCASEIRKAHEFIPKETEVEIRKTITDIWKSAEEGVKIEYHKLNMEYKKAYKQRKAVEIREATDFIWNRYTTALLLEILE